MTLERLCYFVAAAQVLNFTKAAEQCHIAQTAMSRQMAMLEEELGCALFLREHRSVALTEAGKLFYEGVAPLLEQYRQVRERVALLGRDQAGELRIGIGHYEQRYVSSLVEEFHHHCPEAVVTISQYGYHELVERLLRGELDLIFALPVTGEYLADKGVDIYHIFPTQTGVIARREDPILKSGAVSGADMAGRTVITTSEPEGPCSLAAFCQRMAGRNWTLEQVLQANSFSAALLMLQAGTGVMLAPMLVRGELPDSLDMVPLRPEDSPLEDVVAVSRPHSKNPMVKRFLEGITTSKTFSAQWGRQREEAGKP